MVTKTINRQTHTIDASGKVFGRLASDVAVLLRGKQKREFRPNRDIGDFVKVINIDKVKFTGNKLDTKIIYHHSQYPGGLKKEILRDVWAKDPEKHFIRAVQSMLPKNKLAQEWIKRLTVTRNNNGTKNNN